MDTKDNCTLKCYTALGAVAHTCNSSYLESENSLGKLGRFYLKEQARLVVHIYDPSYAGGRDRRTKV
jgi:hypothetical protein